MITKSVLPNLEVRTAKHTIMYSTYVPITSYGKDYLVFLTDNYQTSSKVKLDYEKLFLARAELTAKYFIVPRGDFYDHMIEEGLLIEK